MPPSSTRLEIEEEIVRILSQLDESTRMDPVPLVGTISAAGTITAPMLDRGTLQANRYDGRLIKVAEDATAVAFGTAVTVTGAHTAATTTLTVSSTAEIRSGDILELGTTLEKVLVRAVPSGTTLTVTRGWQGTTAAALSGGETVRYDPIGWVTGVDDGGFAAGGVLTVSPNFAVATYGAGSFLMYPKGYHPDYIVEKMQAVLRNTEGPHIWFPSLVPDSDFSENDTSNWPDVGTPGTKEFSTLPLESYDFFGERYLSFQTNASDEGFSSSAFPVHEGENLLVDAVVLGFTSGAGAGASMQVQLYDAIGLTVLKAVTDLGERTAVEVRFREVVDTDVYSASVRFLSDDAVNSTKRVFAPIIVQSDRRRYYPGPSWLTRQSQIVGSIRLPQGYTSDVADSYIPFGELVRTELGIDFIRSDRDVNPVRVGFSNPGNDPIGLVVQRAFSELAGDNSTTNCDKDYVAFKTVSNILRDRKDSAWRHWAGRASKQARKFGYGGREISVEERPVYVGA